MSLWVEKEVGKFTGVEDKGKAAAAKMLVATSKAWREAYGELPPPTQNSEVLSTSLSKETQKLVESLRNDGYVVYDLAGKSPHTLEFDDGMPLSEVNPILMNEYSSPSLIAIQPNPDKFFLKGSHNLSHDDQTELLFIERSRVDKKYPGAGLVTREGHATEWVETAFMHFEATGQTLFGSDHGYNWTWTDTYENDQPGADRADVGGWGAFGLKVLFHDRDDVDSLLGLAPVLEIPRT